MEQHTLRREAVILRRLLVENGKGDILRLWRLDGRPGNPEVPDADDLARLPHYDGLELGAAETRDLGEGVKMSTFLLWKQDRMPDLEDEAELRPTPLAKY